MKEEKYKNFLIDFISILKEQGIEAKREAKSSDEKLIDYNMGEVMGYYSVITLLKHQALVFEIDEDELGLSDINPEKDLLGLK